MVHLCRVLLRRRFSCQCNPAFRERVAGSGFSQSVFLPPRTGESTALINVLWGTFNLVVGYLLVSRVGTFDLRRTRDVLVVGAGGLLMAVMLSQLFGALYGGA